MASTSLAGTAVQMQKQWEAFAQRMAYLQGDFMKPETYHRPESKAGFIDKQNGSRVRGCFYFVHCPPFY